MTRKPRKPVDTWYFLECVVPAHDSRCAHCGKHQHELKTPLQRGHIKMHANDGSVDPENIVPVCESDNKAHAKSGMEAPYRPDDWREKLAGLVLQRLQPRLYAVRNHADVISQHGNVILKSQPTENAELIDLKNSNFGLRATYIRDSRRMTSTDAQRVVEELIRKGEREPDPTFTPSEGRQRQMREIISQLDDKEGADLAEKIFLGVGLYYLQKKKHLWIRDDRVVADSFGQFVDGFAIHRADRRAAHLAEVKAQRWQYYKRAGNCGEWFGMTDAQRAFRDKAKSESVEREVSDAEIEQAKDVIGSEFLAKKTRCLEFLDLCDEVKASLPELRRYSTEFLREDLRNIQTVSGLHDLHTGIQRLYDMLSEFLGPQALPQEEL